MEKVLVIVGQTAVGKTSLSIKLAKALNGEIINGDAMQIYKEFNILTDKIKESDMGGIPHHLLNIKSISENYSVKEHQDNIRAKIKEITNRNKLPIIVGGTGLYVKASLYDFDFAKQEIDNAKIEEEYKDFSNDELWEKLKAVDPKTCEVIHKNNRRRVIRALEIYKANGVSKSDIIENQEHKLLYDAIVICLTSDKDKGNEKMDIRIEQMFDEGIIDEVKNNPTNTTASKAIGYKEIVSYLNNEISLAEAKELMKIHTHQYAKRQRTWFRTQMNATFINNDSEALNNILNIVDNTWKK